MCLSRWDLVQSWTSPNLFPQNTLPMLPLVNGPQNRRAFARETDFGNARECGTLLWPDRGGGGSTVWGRGQGRNEGGQIFGTASVPGL